MGCLKETSEKMSQRWDLSKVTNQKFMDLEVARLKLPFTLDTNFQSTIRPGLLELLQVLQSEQELR